MIIFFYQLKIAMSKKYVNFYATGLFLRCCYRLVKHKKRRRNEEEYEKKKSENHDITNDSGFGYTAIVGLRGF